MLEIRPIALRSQRLGVASRCRSTVPLARALSAITRLGKRTCGNSDDSRPRLCSAQHPAPQVRLAGLDSPLRRSPSDAASSLPLLPPPSGVRTNKISSYTRLARNPRRICTCRIIRLKLALESAVAQRTGWGTPQTRIAAEARGGLVPKPGRICSSKIIGLKPALESAVTQSTGGVP